MKQFKKSKRKFDNWPNKLALISFIVLLTISIILTCRIYKNEYEEEMLQVKEEGSNINNQLQNIITNSLNVVEIISLIAEKNLHEEEFEIISKNLMVNNKYVDATQLVKEYTIYKTYPLKGNEKTIGYNINADTLNRKKLFEALKNEKIFFEGPIKLIQGGEGIVGRKPIYNDNKFWGFAAVIIKS